MMELMPLFIATVVKSMLAVVCIQGIFDIFWWLKR